MSRRLFVGGLSWAMDGEALREAFAPFGAIDGVTVVMDHETGRNKGFGFVTFSQESDATLAREAMNGAKVHGRMIRVDLAHDRRLVRADAPTPVVHRRR